MKWSCRKAGEFIRGLNRTIYCANRLSSHAHCRSEDNRSSRSDFGYLMSRFAFIYSSHILVGRNLRMHLTRLWVLPFEVIGTSNAGYLIVLNGESGEAALRMLQGEWLIVKRDLITSLPLSINWDFVNLILLKFLIPKYGVAVIHEVHLFNPKTQCPFVQLG